MITWKTSGCSATSGAGRVPVEPGPVLEAHVDTRDRQGQGDQGVVDHGEGGVGVRARTQRGEAGVVHADRAAGGVDVDQHPQPSPVRSPAACHPGAEVGQHVVAPCLHGRSERATTPSTRVNHCSMVSASPVSEAWWASRRGPSPGVVAEGESLEVDGEVVVEQPRQQLVGAGLPVRNDIPPTVTAVTTRLARKRSGRATSTGSRATRRSAPCRRRGSPSPPGVAAPVWCGQARVAAREVGSRWNQPGWANLGTGIGSTR